jgi:hexosaminidase
MAAVSTAAFFLAAAAPSHGQIVPKPQHVQHHAGCFAVDAATRLEVPHADVSARFAADWLTRHWQMTSGFLASSAPRPGHGMIAFVREQGLPGEGYRIAIGTDAITVSASSDVGLFYGAVSLWQLLPPGGGRCIPTQSIDDAPRFVWRGLLLDSSRHFQSVEFMHGMLDWMAWHKLNVLHWHLTDDQGWRVEIKKYPRLTSVGAWRGSYGGFYTQEELRELVSYGALRGVRIVPEIDMPGHVTAALAAYPEYGATGQKPEVSTHWGVHSHLLNLEPVTLKFLEDVLDEVLSIFPSKDIHLGGDEVTKTEWLESAAMRELARSLDLKSAADLQPYLTRHMADYLRSRGRRLVGWDEILTPGLPKDAIVSSWPPLEGARRASEIGNDTVLSPDPNLYLDHRQSPLPSEPPGRVIVISTKDIYNFDPLGATPTPQQMQHVLGVQANLWTEHVRTEPRAEWMMLPRAAALAEVGWSSERDFNDFAARLPALFARYRSAHLNYADSLFGVESHVQRMDGKRVQVQLGNTAEFPAMPGASLRYSVDKPLTQGSARYSKPLVLKQGSVLRSATFVGNAQVSRTLIQSIDTHSGRRFDSRELALCTEGVALLMEAANSDGDAHQPMAIDILNPCWKAHGVDLSRGARLQAAVAPLLFNFEIGKAVDDIKLGGNETSRGELEVHVDDCAAPAVARLPLAGATDQGVSELAPVGLAKLPGRHDLCFTFARPALNPMWGLDWVEFKE